MSDQSAQLNMEHLWSQKKWKKEEKMFKTKNFTSLMEQLSIMSWTGSQLSPVIGPTLTIMIL